MIPIVQTQSLRGENQKIDRRKTRTVSWLEARLCLAREKDSSEPIFGATFDATVSIAHISVSIRISFPVMKAVP